MSRQARAPFALVVPAFFAAMLSLVPVWYLFETAFKSGVVAVFDELLQTRTLQLVVRSLFLMVTVTGASVVIGIFAAWVVARSPLKPRLLLTIAFSLSLAIPSYLAAFAWVSWIPGISGFFGAFIVLTLVCYPFVMLPVIASMDISDPMTERVALTLGQTPFGVFRKITLGQSRPAITSGALLVALYVLSDFGAVAAMRYEVFTWVIYGAYRAGFNPSRAAILSTVLLMAAFVLTLVEARVRSNRDTYRLGSGVRRSTKNELGSVARIATIFGAVALVSLGAGVPIWRAIRWTGFNSSSQVQWDVVLSSITTSFGIGVTTSVFSALVALPIALLSARYRGMASQILEGSTYVAHALPGIVIAISVVFLGVRTLRPFYQEMPLLILAQVLIFLPLAVASMRSAIAMSTQSLESVARSLGAGSTMTLLRVTIPLALPGIMAAGALSMLSSVKELPATLLLRPTGTETLATQIWKFSSVSDYASVGPFALAMILLAVVPVAVLTATTKYGVAR
jgi:iron(III) transport system permease protein